MLRGYQKEAMMTYIDTQRASVMGSERKEERPRRARRCRTQFTAEALQYLESVFAVERYPDINQREQIADRVGVPEARIQTWFQNKRSRSRRDKDVSPRSQQPSPPPAKSPVSEKVQPTKVTVTDSDIEDMREVDPDLQSDDEDSFPHYMDLLLQRARQVATRVTIPPYMPQSPYLNGFCYPEALPYSSGLYSSPVAPTVPAAPVPCYYSCPPAAHSKTSAPQTPAPMTSCLPAAAPYCYYEQEAPLNLKVESSPSSKCSDSSASEVNVWD